VVIFRGRPADCGPRESQRPITPSTDIYVLQHSREVKGDTECAFLVTEKPPSRSSPIGTVGDYEAGFPRCPVTALLHDKRDDALYVGLNHGISA